MVIHVISCLYFYFQLPFQYYPSNHPNPLLISSVDDQLLPYHYQYQPCFILLVFSTLLLDSPYCHIPTGPLIRETLCICLSFIGILVQLALAFYLLSESLWVVEKADLSLFILAF